MILFVTDNTKFYALMRVSRTNTSYTYTGNLKRTHILSYIIKVLAACYCINEKINPD
jgi:hypothetical protein